MDQQPSDEDVRRFGLEATRQRVAYLKFIKSRGYPVDDEQIAEFEEEIRIEEEKLGESQKTWLGLSAVTELQRELAFVDLEDRESLKALILQLGFTKVRMRPEHNHQRAHFHIEYKRQYSASYAVDTLDRLAGDMPKKYERPVLEWAAKYRGSLNATWERLNAGDDIRELVLVPAEP